MPINYSSDSRQPSPRQAILVLRIIWATLLVGQLAFLGVILFLLKSGKVTLQPKMGRTFFLASVVMLAILIPLGWVIRRLIIRPGSDGLISTPRYSRGNIIFYAMCELPSFTGLIGILTSGVYWPNLVVPIIAIAIQIIHFPASLILRNEELAGD